MLLMSKFLTKISPSAMHSIPPARMQALCNIAFFSTLRFLTFHLNLFRGAWSLETLALQQLRLDVELRRDAAHQGPRHQVGDAVDDVGAGQANDVAQAGQEL